MAMAAGVCVADGVASGLSGGFAMCVVVDGVTVAM
jgi:hypothetical protein